MPTYINLILLPEGQAGEVCEPSNKGNLLRMSEEQGVDQQHCALCSEAELAAELAAPEMWSRGESNS